MQTCHGCNWSARLMADRLTQLIHAHQHDPADDQQATEELDQPGSSPSSSHAHNTAKSTSVSEMKLATLDPRARAAMIPVT